MFHAASATNSRCPQGGSHVIQQVYVPAFRDGLSNTCYKCGNAVER